MESAEETKSPKAAEAAPAVETAARKPKKKKSRPTNCAQSNKRIRRKDWYYRDGKYFANKKNYQLFVKAQAAEKAKKAAEAAEKEKAAAAAAPAPAGEEKID